MSYIIPLFYNISHSNISHIHININESRYISIYVHYHQYKRGKCYNDLYCETERVIVLFGLIIIRWLCLVHTKIRSLVKIKMM